MSFITKAFSFFMSLLLSILGTTGLTVQQKAKALRVVAYIIADNAAMMEETDDRRLRVSDPEPCRSSAAVPAVLFGKAAPLARRIP